MGIISWLILGALAGWIASKIMNTDAEQGAIANIVVGIIGAFIGGLVFQAFGASGVNELSIYSLVVSIIGAVILLFIYKALTGRHRGV